MRNKAQEMLEFQSGSNLSIIFQKEFENLAKFYAPIFKLESHETSSLKEFLEALYIRLTKLSDSGRVSHVLHYAEELKKLNAGIIKTIKSYKIAITKLPNTENLQTINIKYHAIFNDIGKLINNLIFNDCANITDNEHSKRLEYLEIISLFMPVLQIFTGFSLQMAVIFSSLDKTTTISYIDFLKEIKSLLALMRDTYSKLQIARLDAKHLQPLWVDTWENDVYPLLYAHSLCDSLDKLKEYSKYWLFIVDGNITLRVKSASMKKYKDYHNKICYHDYNFAMQSRTESIIDSNILSGFEAGLPDPTPIKKSLARLLKDSQISTMELSIKDINKKIDIIDSYLKKHDLSLLFIEALLQESFKHDDNYIKFLTACCQNLTQAQKNTLLIEAAKIGELYWFNILLENGAKCFSHDTKQEDLLSIALDAPQDINLEILSAIAKSDKEELLLCKSLTSTKLANYREKSSGNTLLHELLIRKIGYNFIVAYCALNMQSKLNDLIFVANHNGDSIKKIAKKHKKSDLSHKIEQFQIHLFTRAIYEKNLDIIAAYLKDNGNPNILADGKHPLALVWVYLKNQDKDGLEILEYLIENKCDIHAKICDGKTIGDAIRCDLTNQARAIYFFKKEYNTLQAALKIIAPYENHQKYLTTLGDSYLLDDFKISPEATQNINLALMTCLTKVIIECEINEQDLQVISLLIFTQLCLILLKKFDNLTENQDLKPSFR